MRHTLLWLLAVLTGAAGAHESPATARYLANEGLMVARGETRILFDPLFNEDFGEYRLVPPATRRALMAGEAPWDGIDAVFISHYHDDHFDPADMLEYLRRQGDVALYAPEQAVGALRDAASAADEGLFPRVYPVSLAYGDAPRTVTLPGLLIEAVRIPHAGWPSRLADIENIAWRVTLDDETTVVHLGDADTRGAHYAQDEEFWDERRPNMAFPPYWYFLSESGRETLDEHLRPMHAVGIHVPTSVPAQDHGREPALRGVDLFTRPGETRDIPHDH